MKENIVKTKSFAFALRVVSLYKVLTEEKGEFVLSKQFLRSGTAVGALLIAPVLLWLLVAIVKTTRNNRIVDNR